MDGALGADILADPASHAFVKIDFSLFFPFFQADRVEVARLLLSPVPEVPVVVIPGGLAIDETSVKGAVP